MHNIPSFYGFILKFYAYILILPKNVELLKIKLPVTLK
nr:MAG TPA: hypothetical protein [Caudoviricetes sp.]DAS54915.1 MAG TPA: hypothetical protein [Caudoviricetes sp.]